MANGLSLCRATKNRTERSRGRTGQEPRPSMCAVRAVRRPGSVDLTNVFRQELVGRASLRGNQKNLPGLSELSGNVSDLGSVRRPNGKRCCRGWIRELQALAAIDAAAPQRIAGNDNISRPLAIAGEGHVTGGNTAEGP